MPTHPFRSIPRWKFPKWQPQFQDAILEFDQRKLRSLVEAAATAIFVRLQSQEADPEELRALANALRIIWSVGSQSTQLVRRLAIVCGKPFSNWPSHKCPQFASFRGLFQLSGNFGIIGSGKPELLTLAGTVAQCKRLAKVGSA